MGVQQTRTYGKEYRDNLIDPVLSFNSTQTWNVTSGTGSASIDNNMSYEGESSLKIINNVPTTDLVVTNTLQSTTISNDGNYILSLRLRKDQINEFMTVEVNTFQGAVPFDTQSFVIGSETVEDDLLVNDLWIPFFIDTQYNFTKGDDITFTFTLKGKAGTALLNTTVWIDGLQFEKLETQNVMPSGFKPPATPNVSRNISSTQWSTAIADTDILNGTDLNMFTLFDNALDKVTSGTTPWNSYDIINDKIIIPYVGTEFEGQRFHITIRFNFELDTGNTQTLLFELKRSIDDSIVPGSTVRVQRDTDEPRVGGVIVSYVFDENDPFVLDGFYGAFENNSGVTLTLMGSIGFMIQVTYEQAIIF